jgi:hypothetical protein
MSAVRESTATLRIFGDDLIPEEITKALGVRPTHATLKGEKRVVKSSGREHIAKTGMWRLEAADRAPANLDERISEILSKIRCDTSVWRRISKRFRVNMFCGLFMNESNDGLEVSPATMAALGRLRIPLWFDIYAPLDEKRRPNHTSDRIAHPPRVRKRSR